GNRATNVLSALTRARSLLESVPPSPTKALASLENPLAVAVPSSYPGLPACFEPEMTRFRAPAVVAARPLRPIVRSRAPAPGFIALRSKVSAVQSLSTTRASGPAGHWHRTSARHGRGGPPPAGGDGGVRRKILW